MPFSTKTWVNAPSTSTPLSAAALIDMEARLGAYAELVASAGCQAGVISGGGLTRNSATSITIAAGSAWVKLASGLLTRVSWSSTGLTVRSTPGTTALDQVVVDGTTGVVSIQQGTGTTGVTLDNRTNANDANIDANLLRLHDLNPTNANSGISTTGFRDRRRWAYGFNYTGAAASSSYSNGQGIVGFRGEVGANPLLILAAGFTGATSSQNQTSGVQGYIDNTPRADLYSWHQAYASSGDAGDAGIAAMILPLSAGSHYFSLIANTASSIGATPGASSFGVRELVLPQAAANNGTV